MKALTTTFLLFALMTGVAAQEAVPAPNPKKVFVRGNVRVEFTVNGDGTIKDCRTTVTKLQGGRVIGYEIITRIPRSDVDLTADDMEELADAMLGSPYDLPDSMLCVTIENGTLVEGEDGKVYMDIVVADCEGNVLDSKRKLIAAVPGAGDFVIPSITIPTVPEQGENSRDAT